MRATSLRPPSARPRQRIVSVLAPRRAPAPPGCFRRVSPRQVADVYDEALVQYDVKLSPGELTVFLTERRLAGFADPLGDWGEVAQGGVRLFSFHISPKGSLVKPYVRKLAAWCAAASISPPNSTVAPPPIPPGTWPPCGDKSRSTGHCQNALSTGPIPVSANARRATPPRSCSWAKRRG